MSTLSLFLLFITNIVISMDISPWSIAPPNYTPIRGNLSCNQRVNGSTDSNAFTVFIPFYISEDIHRFDIDTCSSSYNTKMSLYYYWSHNSTYQYWRHFDRCDDCPDSTECNQKNEIWHLESSTKPSGYYFLGIYGYQDNTGDYDILLTCYSMQYIYVSKYGYNHKNCGYSNNNPCGTIYYASDKIDQDYTELYIIDGQNETEIMKQSDCLPKVNINYIYYTYFDPSNISKMEDWYPEICNQHQTNRYLFQNTKDLRFINLLIDDYTFSQQGIIWTEGAVECQNCTFTNISFIIEDNSIDTIYIAGKAIFEDSVFDKINIDDTESDFIHTRERIVFQRNLITNIDIGSNFIYSEIDTNYSDAGAITDCVFDNISSYSIFRVHNYVMDTKYDIKDCSFTNIHKGAIISSIDNIVILKISITNVDIHTDQLYDKNNQINALFHLERSYSTTMNNITINYEYNLFENCGMNQRDELAIQHEYLLISCANPISFIHSIGKVTIQNVMLSNGITNQTIADYNHYILDNQLNLNSNDITINYRYYKETGTGLIHSSGSLDIDNLVIDAVTIHDKMLYLYYAEVIIINGVQINYDQNYCNRRECDEFNPNTLISNTLISKAAFGGITDYVL